MVVVETAIVSLADWTCKSLEEALITAVKIVCDFCNKPLEFEDGRYVIYRTKQIDTRHILPHLCKSCASKLDEIWAETKSRLMTQQEIADRVMALYSQVNQARRERLGTKG